MGLPPRYILKTGSTHPRAQNQTRIAKGCAFLEAPDARLQLSIACLCLRLTTVATSMTAKKNAGMPTTPLLVQLARGDVTRQTSAELHIILENISQDPALSSDVGLVVERLLVTMGELVLRFGQYTNFPCRVVLLSRKFHPGGFYAEALNLLTCDPDKSDRGYSLLLRQEAWNTETAAPVAPPPAVPAVPPQRLVLFVVSAGFKRAAWAPRAGRDRHRLWRHQPGSLAERISRVARGHAGCAGVEAIHADRRLRRRLLLHSPPPVHGGGPASFRSGCSPAAT